MGPSGPQVAWGPPEALVGPRGAPKRGRKCCKRAMTKKRCLQRRGPTSHHTGLHSDIKSCKNLA
eukprot:8887710-Pyramimonas_sp.AAC.2